MMKSGRNLPSRAQRGRGPRSRGNRVATVNTVKSMLGNAIEHKLATYLGSNTFSQSGTILPVTRKIIEGSDAYTRDGHQIRPTLFRARGIFKNVANIATGFSTGVRMVIFKDNRAFGGDPSVTNVLRAASIVANYDLTVTQGHAFTILYDRAWTLTNGASTNAVVFDVKIPLHHTITYYAGTDVAGASGPGGIYVILVTDEGTDPPVFSIDFSTIYMDA